MAFKFEGLKVWQKATDLSENVNELVKGFPKDELYILTSQIKSAADSVALNIAEVRLVKVIRSLVNSWIRDQVRL